MVELLRFTVQDRVLVFDQETKQPGRGGYVVKDISAVKKLSSLKKKVGYFLKVSGDFEITDESIERVVATLER